MEMEDGGRRTEEDGGGRRRTEEDGGGRRGGSSTLVASRRPSAKKPVHVGGRTGLVCGARHSTGPSRPGLVRWIDS
jgi:hypothetical protein